MSAILNERLLTIPLVAALVIAVFATDVLLTSGMSLSLLYVLPMMYAAHRFTPRIVALLTGGSVVAYPFFAALQGLPAEETLVRLTTLAILGVLNFLLALRLEETDRARRAAVDAEARLTRFLAMVAHDLRGPLMTIKLNTQLLAQEQSSPQRRAAELMAGEVRRLERLAADLLDAARLRSGDFQVRPQAMDLVAEARLAIAVQASAAPDHVIELEGDDEVPGIWDRDRIGQVFSNLLSNATKFSPKGGRIHLRVSARPDEAVVEVTDEGIGLPPDGVDALFKPFSRLHTRQQIKGAGLGLYIARGIVSAHGGRIWADSAGPGTGTTIGFALPATPASQPLARQ